MEMLDKITSPAQLKEMSSARLNDLAEELRLRIISVVSKRGGHLASSLGVVELVLALHYILNTPEDIVIWDVGHQAYAHKLLTGRNKQFSSLRQFGGISGFPYHRESDYDIFTVGHSSTAVSLALGMAIGRDLRGGANKVIAVVGDGSLTGGMCLEALNHAGHVDTDILVIVNSNNMAISPVQGAMGKYVNKIISTSIYNKFHGNLKKALLNMPAGKKLVDLGGRIEEALKGIIVPGWMFEEFGFRYFGPIDGHNIELLIETLRKILPLHGPKLLHVITRKGKGYSYAEQNPTLFHGVSGFDIDTGEVKKSNAKTFTNVFSDVALSLAERKDTVFITAAMQDGTGLTPVKNKFPQKVIDVGIAEQHAVSLAAGLSRSGLVPVVAVYSTFLQRAYDQILEDICLQDVGTLFAIDRAGFVGEDGIMHHGLMDIAFLRNMPNMHVLCPRDEPSMKALLNWAYDFAKSHKKPCAVRYPKDVVRRNTGVKPYNAEELLIGRGQVLKKGKGLAVVSLGPVVYDILEIADEEDLDITIIDAVFASPIDIDWIKHTLKGHTKVMTIEEGISEGGWGRELSYMLSGDFIVENIGVARRFFLHGKRSQLLEEAKLDKNSLMGKIMAFLDEKT